MSSAPAWIPLVATSLSTGGITLLGVVITQRSANRREDLQWERMRTQEREQWARDDAMRTFDRRSLCYMDFEEQLRSAALAVYDSYAAGPELKDDWQLAAYHSLLRLQVLSSAEASQAASEVYGALWRWGDMENSYGTTSGIHDTEVAYNIAHEKYLAIIRRDLMIDTQTNTHPRST